MKYMLLLVSFAASFAMAHTITYDNGDVYTVEDNEFVFVAKRDTLFTQQIYNNGKTVQFKKVFPTTKVDYTPVDNGTDDSMQVGSHEWCKAYVPWSEGYTFTMQYWQRGCDTNNDNKYGCGDTGYDASTDGDACPSS